MLKLYKPIISCVLACATFATLAGPSKLDLLLLDAIPSDTPDGRIVVLQSTGSDGCRYFGSLESASHQVDGLEVHDEYVLWPSLEAMSEAGIDVSSFRERSDSQSSN